MNTTALILVLLATLTGAGGITLMKLGAQTLEIKELLHNARLIAGVALFGLSTLLFIVSLNFGELHILYALTGLTYVWLLILTRVFAHEAITRQKIVGTLLIIAGVVLVSTP